LSNLGLKSFTASLSAERIRGFSLSRVVPLIAREFSVCGSCS